jgi:hypothetical protein
VVSICLIVFPMLNGGGCSGNARMGIGGIAAAAAEEEEVVVIVSALGGGRERERDRETIKK